MVESKLAELVARPLCPCNESCLYIFICIFIVDITGNKICLNQRFSQSKVVLHLNLQNLGEKGKECS